MRVITFKIYNEMLEKVDRLANELGVTRSELIRYALTEYIINTDVRRSKGNIRKITLQ